LFTSQQIEALCSAAIILITIGIALFLCHVSSGKPTRKYLYRLSRRIYFCGYSMEKVIQRDFLHNISRYLELDISGIYAVLMMMLLADNRTARIVIGRFTESVLPYERCWVEFRHFGWHAVDPWYEGATMSHRLFKDTIKKADRRRTYTYDDFWHTPAFTQIYRKLLQRNTSYLFRELYAIAGNPLTLDSVIRLTRDYHFGERSGREFAPLSFGGKRVINRKTADFLIQSRDYRKPPDYLVEELAQATLEASEEG